MSLVKLIFELQKWVDAHPEDKFQSVVDAQGVPIGLPRLIEANGKVVILLDK